MGMLEEGAGLRYLWFYLCFSPQSTQRFEGCDNLILGTVPEQSDVPASGRAGKPCSDRKAWMCHKNIFISKSQ